MGECGIVSVKDKAYELADRGLGLLYIIIDRHMEEASQLDIYETLLDPVIYSFGVTFVFSFRNSYIFR